MTIEVVVAQPTTPVKQEAGLLGGDVDQGRSARPRPGWPHDGPVTGGLRACDGPVGSRESGQPDLVVAGTAEPSEQGNG